MMTGFDFPHWLASRFTSATAIVAGVALTLATVLALSVLVWYEYAEVLKADRERGELQARVLDDHATRSIEATSIALSYLSGQLDTTPAGLDNTKVDLMLSQALVTLPFIRSLNVLSSSGLILASSSPAEVGHRPDLRLLGALPDTGGEFLGEFIAGRSLMALEQPSTSFAGSSATGFIPLTRAFKTTMGQELYLIALINPDSFSNFQVLTLNNPSNAAYLLNYKGSLLATGGATTLTPGTKLSQHPVFADYLPGKAHSAYVGIGATNERQVVAFRLSRTRPLVVIVEQPYANSLQRWFSGIKWFALAGLFSIAFLALMTMAVRRSLHARETAHDQLAIARQEAVARERELRVLVKSVQELIFRTDATGSISYVNDRWVALHGQSVEQAINSHLKRLVEPEDSAAVAALFSTSSDAGVRTATARMRSSDGTVHHFDMAVVPLRNSSAIVGFAGSAVDVTDRIAAQQALQHQLGLVASLLESSPLPVSTFDPQGRYITVNRAWEDFMGQSRTVVIGQRGAYFMTPEAASLHAERDAAVWRTGGTLRYEAKVRHRDGSTRDVMVTKVVVAGDRRDNARMLSTMIDVSEFREAEQATRAARDAAEESSRAKSEFIANISHELRTPLQSILGFSELGIMRGIQQPKLHSMFSDIHASGERMLALVNDLLDVSKIESSVGAITIERADVRNLVADVLHELSPQLAGKGIGLAVDLGPKPLLAKVDPVRFQQVIRNITANAIKFSPHQSEIEVRGYLTGDARLCISVRDHGLGIPTAEVEKIFDAFVQSSTTKDGSGGTGLGLAISKKIIEAHDGSIVADNMPDGGAVFRTYLPARHHLDQETTY